MFQRVLEIFRQLCSIPHGSGNTDFISDFCTDFAAALKLRYIRDNAGNVVIFKGGTDGYELCPAVIIQGHLDMVAVKEDSSPIDMKTDGLSLMEDDDFIWADKTSLGGDDAIAVAYALALAESDSIPHPPLEFVLTTNEEVGMDGAKALDTSVLTAHMMINLDSENEGEILAGCAGGVRAKDSLKCDFSENRKQALNVTLSSFEGGHSGTEIDKNRLNAIIELSKALSGAKGIRLCKINGGSADNAIPSFCSAEVVCADKTAVKKTVEAYFEKEIKPKEKNAVLTFGASSVSSAISEADTENALRFISEIPNGVVSFNDNIDGLVSTSLNLGTVETTDGMIILNHALRSDSEQSKTSLKNDLAAYCESFGAKTEFSAEYSAWEYQKNSPLRETFKEAYRSLYGKEMTENVIHAGLECGIFSSKIHPLDCVSLGPNIYDIHTTKEKLDKKSAERVFELLKAVLEKLA